MSWNTSKYLATLNSLITIMSNFEMDTEEAGEAYIELREELLQNIDKYQIDIVFDLLLYLISISKLSLADDHNVDFKLFWKEYLLALEEASHEYLLSSCAEVEAILPYVQFLMTGSEGGPDDDSESWYGESD